MSVTVNVSSVMQVEDAFMVIPLPEEAAGKIVKLEVSGGKIMRKLKITNWTSDRIEGVQCTDVSDDEVVSTKEVDPATKTLKITLSDMCLGKLSNGGIITLIDMFRG